ncbi:ribonuclease P protein component [Methylobacillus gramineus]|uniref:ribonuclease P protein component n=1 Tax=Methylobacillus gramineus TaxID=755169 RepID=UPI001CFFFD4F|nr:ribonuclease P protein component [Methylobacillus gramineus]MCB5185715.1 ribonuclease P protein component [Methylobacillus gramineus]
MVLPSYAFTRRAKLLKTDEFSSVFNFRKRVSGRYIVLHYQCNTLGNARLGLVVGKKVARRAVDRNYMKRVLRELFRVRQDQLQGLDIVARPQKQFSAENFAEIQQEFIELVENLQRKLIKHNDEHEAVL